MILGTACYLRHGGKTLMLHRNKKKNDIMKDYYSVPGGKIEKGESPEDSITREFFEETGLKISDIQMKGFIVFDNSDKEEDWAVFMFTADSYEGTLKECREGTLEWKDTSSILELNIRPGDRLFIPYLEKQGFFSAKITHKDEKIVGQEFNVYR